MISKLFLIITYFVCVVFGQNSSCIDIISRQEWRATAVPMVDQAHPVQYVIIIHTVTDFCNTFYTCSLQVKALQSYHMTGLNLPDISSNFLIGDDGNVYQGVGWHKVGSHTENFNNRSIAIAFIGNFNERLPDQKALDAAQKLLECGVQMGELDRRYRLLSQLQIANTESPGRELNYVIQGWDNWVPQP